MAGRIDQVNVVVSNVEAVTTFLAALGVDPLGGSDDWARHHLSIPTAGSGNAEHDPDGAGFGLDLDSSVFARQWGGLPTDFSGVVVNIGVEDRSEVDRLHDVATALGARSLSGPHDAFWGSRYATVEGPGLVVGIRSVPDATKRSAPPNLASLG